MNADLKAFQESLSETRPKIPFIAKLLLILNYTLEHPDTVGNIGVFWLPDQQSIVSNSAILGAFLGIKSNSINTNFREEGFTPPRVIPKQWLVRQHPCLQGIEPNEATYWKKRKHADLQFTPTMAAEQAIALGAKCRLAFRRNRIQQAQQGKKELLPFRKSPSSEQATQQWAKHFRSAQWAPLDDVLNAFLPMTNYDFAWHIDQLRVNFTHLCSRWMKSEAFLSRELTLGAFIAFFHCFGSSRGVRARLEEITPAESLPGPFPWFYVGICLGANKRCFEESWRMAEADTWALVDGEKEDTFQFLTRARTVDGNQDRCRTVWVNTTNEQQLLSFQINDDGLLTSVPNVSALLESLGLFNHTGLRLNQSDVVKQSPWPFELSSEVMNSPLYKDEMLTFPYSGE
jgi:hypothetical protein